MGRKTLTQSINQLSLWPRVGAGGETGGDIKHMCNQGVATFADDCLSGSRQSTAGAALSYDVIC